ncbi:hypothetical protein HMPREF1624_00457 [Sporothrix schenckii ATCC 58251]|uniref:PinX1-related protein 1 n=1 Tax=Sporothrix schenckii (strain ATCC 58251 / de Perez 2211183) TaxID=1391915 RepID=U7Q2N0_SPOS1|nr:hypothetical protein HMPREF1624_00457 [Sporothrix schenckii ATCC 58251]
MTDIFSYLCSKRKIGDDPNNTKWARNTQNYGHKILRSHGWEPGQYLGQKDAAHTMSYTAASSSHIRAILREDNLGIGASGPGANTANECTGLDIFKDLLGRLNGKSEAAIEQQRQARENVKTTLYIERRFGPMRFVRGGFLIGDDETFENKKEPAAATEEAAATSEATPSSSESEADTDDSKEARRKAKTGRKEEKKEKSRKWKVTSNSDEADRSDQTLKADDSDRKDKKRKRSKDDVDEDEKAAKTKKTKKEKKEKKAKKEKKEKKEKKVKKDKSDTKEKKEKKGRRGEECGDSTPATTETGEEMDTDTATPSESEKTAGGVPSTFTVSSRNLARRRYINQKRAAVADPQALKQIFMIKA